MNKQTHTHEWFKANIDLHPQLRHIELARCCLGVQRKVPEIEYSWTARAEENAKKHKNRLTNRFGIHHGS